MEIKIVIYVIFVVCLAYSVEILFGLGGTVLMLLLLSFFFNEKDLIIYSVLPQVIVALMALLRSHKRFIFREFLYMTGAALAGGLLGGMFFYAVSGPVFRISLIVLICLSGLYMIFFPEFHLNRFLRSLLDLFAGFSHTAFGISGPLVMTRLMGTMHDKTTIRNNALAFYLFINMVRGSGYIVSGSFNSSVVCLIIITVPFLPLSLLLADRLHERVPNDRYKRLVSLLIFLSGLVLLVRAVI